MSIRTAIEINNDFHAHQKGKFIGDLMWTIYHGNDADWEDLRRRYGVERVYQCHDADDRLQAHKDQRHPANFRRTP